MMEIEQADKGRLVTSPIVVSVATCVVFYLFSCTSEVCLGVKKKKQKWFNYNIFAVDGDEDKNKLFISTNCFAFLLLLLYVLFYFVKLNLVFIINVKCDK